LAVVVVGVAIAATATLHTAVLRDPGYRADGVWTAHIALASTAIDADRAAASYDRILQRLREQPAVKAAAVASLFPVGEQPSVLVSPERAEGARRMATLDAASLAVSPEFFLLLRMPLLDGGGCSASVLFWAIPDRRWQRSSASSAMWRPKVLTPQRGQRFSFRWRSVRRPPR